MTLSPRYFDLMDHLGQTQPVCAMPPGLPAQDMVCLRHDIDHSLDVALEMAFWEHDRGLRATYYLLNSTEYWSDPDFDIKVRQLLDFGHEVGVHVNSVANWLGGRCDDPASDLHAALARLRALGAEANSTAAHGDRLCYQHGVTNFWMFSDEMAHAKSGEPISAEGITVSDPAFQIKFPDTDRLTRADGQSFDLGSLDVADFGLSFLAHRAGWDRYFSDSGGGWTRTQDPLDVPDIATGRTMVLVHPIHWRAPPRQIYVLSPARSGSTWLARVADQASSAIGLHEQSLNHRNIDGVFTAQKRTHTQIDALYESREEQLELLRDRRTWFETQVSDVLECNVYLAPVLDTLKQVNPEARFAALLRDPREILVSLLNRGWYDSADDDKHPRIDVPGWDDMDQVGKAAHYIADTRARILEEPDIQLADLKTLNQTPEGLRDFFVSLGIAFYPRLAEPLRDQRINANTITDVEGFDALPERDQLRALEIIFAGGDAQNIYPHKPSAQPLPNPRAFGKQERTEIVSKARFDYLPTRHDKLSVRRSSDRVTSNRIGPWYRMDFRFTVPAEENGTVMIGLPQIDPTALPWHAQLKMPRTSYRRARIKWDARHDLASPLQRLKVSDSAFDFTHSPDQNYRLSITNLRLSGLWQLMVQTFDAQGAPGLLKRVVNELKAPALETTFELPASAHSMRIALYAPRAPQIREISFSTLQLDVAQTTYKEVPLHAALAKSRVLVLAHAPWTADHGSPEAAKALSRAGLGTVIWASFAPGAAWSDTPFVNSEGINFITLDSEDASQFWAPTIARLKKLRADRVIDLDGAAPASLKVACANAKIDLVPASRAELVSRLKTELKT